MRMHEFEVDDIGGGWEDSIAIDLDAIEAVRGARAKFDESTGNPVSTSYCKLHMAGVDWVVKATKADVIALIQGWPKSDDGGFPTAKDMKNLNRIVDGDPTEEK